MKITFVRTPFTLLSFLSSGWMMATVLPTTRAESDTVVVVKNLRNVPQLFPQESRRLLECPADENENLTCQEQGDQLGADYQASIDSLEEEYDDENCKDKLENRDPSSKGYKKCEGYRDAICSLESAKDEAVEQTVTACEQTQEVEATIAAAEATIAAAKAEFNARRALVPVDAQDPDLARECVGLITTSLSVKKSITTTIKAFGISIDVLEAVNDALGDIKDTLDGSFFGVPAGAIVGLAITVITAVVLALEIAIKEFEDFLAQVELDDDENKEICSDIQEVYRRALAEDTNDHVEVIENTTEENQAYLEFLSCRFGENPAVFVGAGCDGLDNDCDSNVLLGIIKVDECDEDQVPPTLELSKDPPATFFSQEEGVAWFMENTVVSDDCAPQARLIKTVVESNVEGQVTIRVDDTRCSENTIVGVRQRALTKVEVDGPGEPTTTRTFFFEVDGEAPTVTCGFGAGGNPLVIDRFEVNRDLVDVQFWFNIAELPVPSTAEDVQVTVTVESNEYEASTREMLRVFKERSRGGANRSAIRFNALLAPYTCGDSEAESPCLSETGGADAPRFYDITVVATDSSGNTGEATCTVVAVPEYDPNPNPNPSSKKKERPTNEALLDQLDSSSKRFMLEEIQFVYNTSEDVSPNSPAATLPPARNGNNGSLQIP